jgi:hypothetical protein
MGHGPILACKDDRGSHRAYNQVRSQAVFYSRLDTDDKPVTFLENAESDDIRIHSLGLESSNNSADYLLLPLIIHWGAITPAAHRGRFKRKAIWGPLAPCIDAPVRLFVSNFGSADEINDEAFVAADPASG